MSKCPYCKDKGYMVYDDKIGSTTPARDLVPYCPHCSTGKQLASLAHCSDPQDEVRGITTVIEVQVHVSIVPACQTQDEPGSIQDHSRRVQLER